MRRSSDIGAKSAASGAATPSTVAAAATMSRDDPNRDKPGTIATLARADRAYHDPAQFHLHEFGGGGE